MPQEQSISNPSLSGSYYSNILLVSKTGIPLTTVSQDRAEWYVKRGLGELLSEEEAKRLGDYSKVVRLKFRPKLEDNRDKFYTQILETRCVVCGERHGLSLHHVVPTVIRQHMSEEHKNHAHGWCVLLCQKHHHMADEAAEQLHRASLKEFNDFMNDLKASMKDAWAKRFIKSMGGPEGLKDAYREKFKSLNPQFLPNGFLQDHKPLDKSTITE